MDKEQLEALAKAARSREVAKWRRANPEKQKAIMTRYWQRRGLKEALERGEIHESELRAYEKNLLGK